MTMFGYVPTSVAAGEPESRPVVSLKVAHEGLRSMRKARAALAAGSTRGWKEYLLPAVTVVAGTPSKVTALVLADPSALLATAVVGAGVPAVLPEQPPRAAMSSVTAMKLDV
jgi:hypothetical protein